MELYLGFGPGWFLLSAAIVIYPLWRIFSRAGLNPALSLLIFLPGLGWFVVAFILGFARWPALGKTVEASGRPTSEA